MNVEYDILIIGNQPAALTGVEACLASGKKVLWCKGAGSGGGIFRGKTLEGKTWDMGMNLLEFTAQNSGNSNDILSYSSAKRYDHVRFLGQIESYLLNKTGKVNTISPPQMIWRGKRIPDLMISNDLSVFQFFTPEEKEIILKELENLPRNPEWHAGNKQKHADLFMQESYAEIAAENHGNYLHAHLFAPWIHKISGDTEAQIPALLHRQIWAPLWYPETLYRAISDPDYRLTRTVFSYPEKSNFGKWMEDLETDIRKSDRADVLDVLPESLLYTDEGWVCQIRDKKYSARYCAYSGDLSRMPGLKQEVEFKRGNLGLVAVEVPSNFKGADFSVINLVDTPGPFFRITNQTQCAGIPADTYHLMLEYAEGEIQESYIREILEISGIILKDSDFRIIAILPPRPAFVLPVFENLQKFRNLHNYIREMFPELMLLGSADSISSVSLNDQIIQGLQLGQKICG